MPLISIGCVYSKLNYILSGQEEIAFSACCIILKTSTDNSVHKVLRNYNILNSKHTLICALDKSEVNQRYQNKFVHFFTNQNFDTNHRNCYIQLSKLNLNHKYTSTTAKQAFKKKIKTDLSNKFSFHHLNTCAHEEIKSQIKYICYRTQMLILKPVGILFLLGNLLGYHIHFI